MPEAQLQAAILALKERSLLLEEKANLYGDQLAEHSFSASQKPEAVDICYTFAEITPGLYKTGREIFGAPFEYSKMTLEKAISSWVLEDLYTVAENYQLDPGMYLIYPRNELRALLAHEFSLPESVSFALNRLNPSIRLLYQLIKEKGGVIPIQEVRAYLNNNKQLLYEVLQVFTALALVFDTFRDQQRVLYIPFDIFMNNTRPEPGPEEAAQGLVLLETPPQEKRTGDFLLLYDLAILIGAVYQQAIEPTQAGRIPKRIAAKIRPLLHGASRIEYDEDIYLDMLFVIAQRLGLVQLSPPFKEIKSRFKIGPKLAGWADLSRFDQSLLLLNLWLNNYDMQDQYGVAYVYWMSSSWYPLGARSVILKYLKNCEPEKWYSISSLLHMIWQEEPFALRSQSQVGGKKLRPTSEIHAKWLRCEGELYTGILASTLYELGLVNLGYHDAELSDKTKQVNPRAVMLTKEGARLINALEKVASSQETSPHTQNNRALIVQPNFELLLLQPDFFALYRILPFSQVKQVGPVSHLMLTQASILCAIEQGLTTDFILQTLEELSQKAIPQNVSYTIRDWAKNYKGVTITQVFLLEITSETLADELCTSAKFQQFGLRKLSPCTVAASNIEQLMELYRTLKSQGITIQLNTSSITPSRPEIYF